MMQLLRQGWQLWKRFGLFMGNIVAFIILTLFYFTIVLPFGLGVRLFGDPMEIRNAKPVWKKRENTEQDLNSARGLG